MRRRIYFQRMLRRMDLNRNHLAKYLGIILVIASIMWMGNYLVHEVVETIGDNKGKNLPIYSVETTTKVVSITFDAAWGNSDTQKLLDVLDKYNIKATFFIVGDWAEKYPEDVKEMYARGHDIGNHSATHPDMTALKTAEMKDELTKAHNQIKELIGYDMFLFRAPYGAYNEKVVDAAKECGYYTVQWDVDSLDWKEYGVDNEVKTVLNHPNLQSGSILLFHNDTKFTPDALPQIIEGLMAQGYTFVPLSQLILQEDYKIDHTGRQFPTNDVGEPSLQ